MDVTKPHLKKKAKVIKIGETPPLNKTGFWIKKNEHSDPKEKANFKR